MNILFLSKLSGNLYAGPNNSVPAQVKAQMQVDNVFWYNMTDVKREEWIKLGCRNLMDYPSERLNELPHPFDNPDIVIVEEFFCHTFSKIIRDIQIKKIPYIIIPRSQMTRQSFKKGKLKKFLAKILYLNKFVSKASAIQYLSFQEYKDSNQLWGKKYFIIPNGTEMRKISKKEFPANAIRAVYIGRYEKYQKGLDLLIEAIGKVKNELKKVGFVLNMYGVDQEGTVQSLKEEIIRQGIDDLIVLNDAVFGADKEKVLLQADLFILTSRFEGMPMGLIEAFSYGVPVIASVGTNLVEAINKFNAGWTCDISSEGISRALIEMSSEQKNFSQISLNAMELAKTFSWNNIALESHRQYQEMLR